MTLVTLFSAPKAFTDARTAVSQRNAIQSWTQLEDTDILLLGEEDGLAEAAREMGARHVAPVARNQGGVPLISAMFRVAREASDSPLLCIVNADIILMSDFTEAARSVASLQSAHGPIDRFVLVSQRWDLDLPDPLEFSKGWEGRLRSVAQMKGRLHRPTGSDIFVFPRQCYADVPDFAVGRAGWDNWMIYKAREETWPVIDGTPSMVILHQNHDYRHLPDGKPHYDHPDTEVNTRLAGGQAATRYTILDSTHVLVQGRLVRPTPNYPRLLRGLEVFLRRMIRFLPESMTENVVRPQRWNKLFKRILRRIHS